MTTTSLSDGRGFIVERFNRDSALHEAIDVRGNWIMCPPLTRDVRRFVSRQEANDALLTLVKGETT